MKKKIKDKTLNVTIMKYLLLSTAAAIQDLPADEYQRFQMFSETSDSVTISYLSDFNEGIRYCSI